jgi:hypothetical protein
MMNDEVSTSDIRHPSSSNILTHQLIPIPPDVQDLYIGTFLEFFAELESNLLLWAGKSWPAKHVGNEKLWMMNDEVI